MEINQNKLIFIVEDNDIYSLMLDYSISNESIAHCICFKTGEECIASLHMEPMLIILDYELPRMDGKETLKKIKKIKPEIPVVILSVSRDQKLIQELFDEGAYDYLIKEKSSLKKLKGIINSIVNRITTTEHKALLRMKAFFLFLLVIALTIVTIYFKHYSQ